MSDNRLRRHGLHVLRWGIICIAVAVMGVAASSQQATDPQAFIKVTPSRTTGLAAFITARDGGPLPVAAGRARAQAGALGQFGHLMGIGDPATQLAQQKIETDALGHTHTTYQQVHRAVPVFSGVVKVHQDRAGRTYAINGDFYPIKPTLSIEPRIDEAHARATAQALMPDGPVTFETVQLVIVNPSWYGGPNTGARLAWHVVVRVDPAARMAFMIDALNGEVIDEWSMLCTIIDRSIHDANGTSALPGPLARAEGNPPTGDAETDAAYDYFGDTYDYFFRAHSRDGIDDAGMTLVGTVDSTAPTCPNAFWNGVQMVFCAGTATDDIIGHELTHGVTQHTADLIYRNQSGQLNESFSDVFGELIDLFNGDAAFAGAPGGTPWPTHSTGSGLDTPNNLRTDVCTNKPDFADGVRWMLAEDSAAFSAAIRDMWNPPCRNHPDFANSPLQTCPSNDNGGVHQGSGVPNHAFAMVTDGKDFNGFSVTGIGPIKSGAVWYRTLSLYLTPASDFLDAYAAFNQSAADLVGTFPNDPRTGAPSADMFTAFDAAQVDLALLATEMNTDGACGESDNVLESVEPVLCSNIEVVFSDDFESGAPGWTVSNSGPPTPYDWELTTDPLPFDRAGVAWFVADPSIGDCGANDESGVHSLTSPVFDLPESDDVYLLSFTHFLESEGAWDGGNMKMSIDGGPWKVVQRALFEHNPYNGKLRSAPSGNTNPLEDEVAWTGAGGQWGRSVINLSGFAAGGQSVQFRFDFGKDGCTGLTGWYVDDFEILRCPDSDADGTSDFRDVVQIISSQPLAPVGSGIPSPSIEFDVKRPAMSDVVMRFTAYADLGHPSETLTLELNTTDRDTLFEVTGADCAFTPAVAEVTIPAAEFNGLVQGKSMLARLVSSPNVGDDLCNGDNYVTMFITYERAPRGDVNGDGLVNVTDLLALLSAWGPCTDPCFEDIDNNGTVNVTDLLAILAAWSP